MKNPRRPSRLNIARDPNRLFARAYKSFKIADHRAGGGAESAGAERRGKTPCAPASRCVAGLLLPRRHFNPDLISELARHCPFDFRRKVSPARKLHPSYYVVSSQMTRTRRTTSYPPRNQLNGFLRRPPFRLFPFARVPQLFCRATSKVSVQKHTHTHVANTSYASTVSCRRDAYGNRPEENGSNTVFTDRNVTRRVRPFKIGRCFPVTKFACVGRPLR